MQQKQKSETPTGTRLLAKAISAAITKHSTAATAATRASTQSGRGNRGDGSHLGPLL